MAVDKTKLTRIQQVRPIVDNQGRPMQDFVRNWNDLLLAIEKFAGDAQDAIDDVASGGDATQAYELANAAYNLASNNQTAISNLETSVWGQFQDVYSHITDLSEGNNINLALTEIMVLDEWLSLVESDLAALTVRVEIIEAEQIVQNDRLTAIEEEQIEQNEHLADLDNEQDVQDGRLDAIETEQTEQNDRLDVIESDIADIETEQITQNDRLDDHQTRIENIESRPKLKTKQNDIEVVADTQVTNFTGDLVTVTSPSSNQADVDVSLPAIIQGGFF